MNVDWPIEVTLTPEELEELLRDLPEIVRELEAGDFQNASVK